jgi:predicted HD phosphohydrolase
VSDEIRGSPPGLAPLAEPGWAHVDKASLEDFRRDDWLLLARQRQPFYAERQAAQVLAMLQLMEHDPSWGYRITMFQHALQSATMALRDGRDEETIVTALLHDIGFMACPSNHGPFAAALLGPYVSEANRWMLEHHQIFQNIHIHEHPDVHDPNERERWRGHPHFEWTAEFLVRYDIASIDPAYDTAPLAAFAPMVHRVFSAPPRRLAIP